ncbi:unnamed protein product [Sphagnum jensenii]|uniref:Kinesin motor domain-containing protein n=1 Tax=Sphagnum jensenii TaxID=128206 RepID=A0ABP0X4W5_9BRYO
MADGDEQARVVNVDPSFANAVLNSDAFYCSEEYMTAQIEFVATQDEDCSGGGSGTRAEVMETDDEDEEQDAPSVKRLSLEIRDGRSFPKFSPGDVILAVNSGGLKLEDAPTGFEFAEDGFFSGGDVLRTEEHISGAQEPCLYQTARYGDLSYSFKDLAAGNYVVDLHFAEIIFTNGPPGMRVFDVLLQGKKVVSELDVYEEVGSNSALILSVSTLVTEDGTLCVAFEGVIGSPTISAICVRSARKTRKKERDWNRKRASSFEGSLFHHAAEAPCDALSYISCYQEETPEKDEQAEEITEPKPRSHQMKNKGCKCVKELEAKVQELQNECHEAWISLQDANRTNEMLRDDLVAKSLCFIVKLFLLTPSCLMKDLKRTQRCLSHDMKNWISSLPDVSTMTTAVQALVNEHQDLRKRFSDEVQERKRLYNKVLELKGNIRVFCRCRPLSASEIAMGSGSVAEFESAMNGDLIIRTGTAGKKLFKFDQVFSPEDGQDDVFADTAPVVVSVLDGYNVCIFAYGQTGTGKTFTMEGCEGNRGVNYRTLEELFHVASLRQGLIKYEISVSVLEVYNEQIRDLLAPPLTVDQTPKKLEVKQMPEGGHHVPGLVEAKVQSMEEVWEVLQTGSSARTIGSTRSNDLSSRSHCMLCVMVKGESEISGECTKSKLWLVDLAGSERVAKSDVQGDRLKEAQCINKSLSALGDVIQALTTKSSHIPFRNSKLTHLLQDSLGGDSKTLMFVQISPYEGDVGETLCSLNFASRVRGIELGPARKQLDTGELFKYKQLAERAKQDGRSKEEAVKKLEESLRQAEMKLKAKEQMYQTLSEKLKEYTQLEVQLVSERTARQGLEASLWEQKMMTEKIAAESRAAAEKAAAESDKAVKEALERAAMAHANEVNRLLQQCKASTESTTDIMLHQPAMVETGASRPPLAEKANEYVQKVPDPSDLMHDTYAGDNFANENANPQQSVDFNEPFKVRGILKSMPSRLVSPSASSLAPGKARRTTFGVSVKPTVVLSSLVRRSQESASNHSSVTNSLNDEDLKKLLDGTQNMSQPDSSNIHSLETPPTKWKQSSLNRQSQKSVHFRSPLLLPPREGARLEDLETKTDLLTEAKAKMIRRISTAKPLGKPAGAQRVMTPGIKSSASLLREKRWNK